MIKKNTTEENDTNEKTTKIWFAVNKYSMINTDPPEQIPERNPSLEYAIFCPTSNAGRIPPTPEEEKIIKLTTAGWNGESLLNSP
jgi:hypothetical protein